MDERNLHKENQPCSNLKFIHHVVLENSIAVKVRIAAETAIEILLNPKIGIGESTATTVLGSKSKRVLKLM